MELNITISREEQEQAFQQTSLRIRTSSVDEKAKELRTLARSRAAACVAQLSVVTRTAASGKCFAARTAEKLPGAHAIARLVREVRM